MEKPPTLEYEAPQNAMTPARHVAREVLIVGGIIDALWGLVCLSVLLVVASDIPSSSIPNTARVGLATLAAYGVSCLVCGTLYIIGSAIVFRRRNTWEVALLICTAFHGAIVLLPGGLVAFFAPETPVEICILSFLFAHFVSLAFLFIQVRRAMREQ